MSNLHLVKRGKKLEPRKFFIYGPAGLGKTTLAADTNNPIFIDIDDGSAALDVARYPFDAEGRTCPKDYQEVLSAIDDLITGEHSYKTLVIDTVDKLEAMLHQYMLERDSKSKNKARNDSQSKMTGIEDYGYGKGYSYAVDEFRILFNRLDELRLKRNMDIVMLAHIQVKNFKNPEGPDFDRYIAKINEKAFGVFKEWCHVVGAMNLDVVATKAGTDDDRARGVSTGTRILYTQPNGIYEVKSRGLMLADAIEIPPIHPWSVIREAIAQSDTVSTENIEKQVRAILETLPDGDFKTRATNGTNEAASTGDRDRLIKILAKLNKNKETINA